MGTQYHVRSARTYLISCNQLLDININPVSLGSLSFLICKDNNNRVFFSEAWILWALISAHLPLLSCQSNHPCKSNTALLRRRCREGTQKVSPLSFSSSKLKQRWEQIAGMFKQHDRGHGSCGEELARPWHLGSLGRMMPGGCTEPSLNRQEQAQSHRVSFLLKMWFYCLLSSVALGNCLLLKLGQLARELQKPLSFRLVFTKRMQLCTGVPRLLHASGQCADSYTWIFDLTSNFSLPGTANN